MGLNHELDGLLVVTIEQAVAAPYCSLLLADAGARVIKVERPEGDFARGYDRGAAGQSAIFAWLNRGKESICIDLNKERDATLLHRILADADILLSNLAPGSLNKRGFSGDRLREENPRLITCSITGYGDDGPFASKKAYDFLVQAESGVCAVTGTEEEPARVGVSITDISTGLTAFSAILRALLQRGRTGVGIDINLSMFDVMADWMNMPLMGHRYFGGAPARSGLTHSFVAPYGAFSTGDGGQILLSVQNNREWASLCRNVLERPDLVDDPRFAENADRYANREELADIINGCFGAFKRGEIIDRLDTARIANARLNSVSDLSEHVLLKNQSVRFGDAEISVADLPVRIDADRCSDVPMLDEHGEAIRRQFVAAGHSEREA